jgi:uncharacterized damage-inducible protein DinB
MFTSAPSLALVFEGWEGYRQSILHAVTPLTSEQLKWRPAPQLRSAGEVGRHIALGSINWFLRMEAPGSRALASQIAAWDEDPHVNRYIIEVAVDIADQASELVKWLTASGQMITDTLRLWTVEDLQKTYRHTWRGTTYAISRQWTLWRILAHDLHHGGELALLLGMQGLENFELGALGGHITEPARADQS